MLHRAAAILVLLAGLSEVTKVQNRTPSVDVTGTRVSMVPPADFELADRFPGVVRTNGPTRIAGKPAHELVGTALHHAGYPVALYLVVVADGVGHLQLVGICRLDDESKYFPGFREMVRNLSLLSR